MANEIKTRDPQAELYHKDYLTWINITVDWLGTQVGDRISVLPIGSFLL